MHTVQLKKLALALSGLMGAGLAPAYAQTARQVPPQSTTASSDAPASASSTSASQAVSLANITVTGTLISGVAPVGTPTMSMDRQDIRNSGSVRIGDLFNSIPAITNSFNQIQNVGAGASGVTSVGPNIHNLGPNTTLTLVNGHDVVGTGILQTGPDINILPPGALQRIDIVTDGGSALYGADAVGGIVNLITRTEMEGTELDVHQGLANGYNLTDGSLSFGHEWSHSSFMASYSFRQSSDLFGADRPYNRTNLVPFGGTDYRVNECSPSNVAVNGTSYAMPSLVANTENKCDWGTVADIIPAETQNSLYAAFTDDISDSTTFTLTSTWNYRKTRILLPQVASSNTITNVNPYFMPIGDETSQLVSYSYSPVAGPSTPALTDVKSFDITPELTFQLGNSWSLDTLVYMGRATTSGHSPEVNSAAETTALAGTTTATALDPYYIAQTNDQVISNILNYEQFASNRQTLVEAKAVAQGPLMSLPGGSVHAAIGAQYEYQGSQAVQTDAPRGDLTGAAHASTAINSRSVFGELLIPIVGSGNSIPGVRALVLDLQGRYDKYNVFGNTTNPKIGLKWEVANGISFNATWGTSFVAPSSADLTGSIDTRLIDFPTSVFGPGPVNQRPTLVLAGGGDVKPMTSTTYTAGVTFMPDVLPSSTLSLTYWNTTVKGIIGIYPFFNGAFFFDNFPNQYLLNPTMEQVLAFEGSNRRMQGPSLASLYSDPNNTPYAILDAQRTNLGQRFVNGLDFDWNFNHATSFGSVLASASATYVLNQTQKVLANSQKTNMLVAGNNISRLLASASIGMQYGRFLSKVRINWSSGFPVALPNQTHVDAFHPIDLLFAYDLGDQLGLKSTSLTLQMNNITNEHPGFVNNVVAENGIITGAVTNGQTYGRYVELGVHAAF